MTSNQGQTETNDIQSTTDDVEGHRIASFIEDYKADAMGLRRSAEDDVEGHRVAPFTDEGDEDDVAGHKINR